MGVFVRWYGSILQGEVVENQEKGILSGMVAVRIQVQGAKATALFVPEHVYESMDAASASYPVKTPDKAIADLIQVHKEQFAKESVGDFIRSAINLQSVENFKAANWDHEHNHLRIDALDQFYRLWRDNMAIRLGTNKPQPAMKMEAPLTPDEASVTLPSHKPQHIVSDKRMAELKGQLKKSLKPVEAKQLTLFD